MNPESIKDLSESVCCYHGIICLSIYAICNFCIWRVQLDELVVVNFNKSKPGTVVKSNLVVCTDGRRSQWLNLPVDIVISLGYLSALKGFSLISVAN